MRGRATLLWWALVAAATGPADAADSAAAEGERVFSAVCQACHQAGGVGAPGLAPALAGTLATTLGSEAGRHYLTLVLLNGLSGPIRSQGQLYTGAMPAQSRLSDQELAAAASYVAQSLNGLGSLAFSAEEFAQARAQPVPHKALRAMREKLAAP